MRGGVRSRAKFTVCAWAVLLLAGSFQTLQPSPGPGLTGTVVSGDIMGNVTWTTAGSPYWIVADTYVYPGVSVQVEPGVIVRFGNANLTVFGGQLEAPGRADNPIVFATNATPPTGWGNIDAVFGGSVLLRNATLESVALRSQMPGPFVLDRILFEHSTGTIVYDGGPSFLLANSTIGTQGSVQIRGANRATVTDNLMRVSFGAGGVVAENSQAVVIRGNFIRGHTTGIQVSGDGPRIFGNEISNCTVGIEVRASDALVAGNRVYGCGWNGISLSGAVRASVTDNAVHHNGVWGLSADQVQGADIHGNAFFENGRFADGQFGGVILSSSSSISLHDNTVQGNTRGIVVDGGQFHRIYHNWIQYNVLQAYDTSPGSSWDDGYPSGGNHWSDYAGDDLFQGWGQDVPGPDGIGDTPRAVLPGVAADRYPFYSVPAPDLPRQLTADAVGSDVVLTWQPAAMADAYLLYTADDPTGFDFSAPTPLANVTSWTDVGAAAMPGERYYVLRGHNTTINRTGPTGNTAGKWTHVFPTGTSTFSLPLHPYPWVDYSQPVWIDTVGELAAATAAMSVAYMNSGTWRFVPGDGDANRAMRTGEGYIADLPAAARFTFTGVPAAMVDYAGWPPYPLVGFEPQTTARNVSARGSGSDVLLGWDQLPGLAPNGTYQVYASRNPAGLRGYPGLDYNVIGVVAANGSARASFTHIKALLASSEWYYFVIPVREVYWRGASTYSMGVVAMDLDAGYSAVALPLRPFADSTYLSVPVSSLVGGGLDGAQWFDLSRQDWVAHSAWMAAGMYDTPFTMIMAVQIDARSPTRIVFVGV